MLYDILNKSIHCIYMAFRRGCWCYFHSFRVWCYAKIPQWCEAMMPDSILQECSWECKLEPVGFLGLAIYHHLNDNHGPDLVELSTTFRCSSETRSVKQKRENVSCNSFITKKFKLCWIHFGNALISKLVVTLLPYFHNYALNIKGSRRFFQEALIFGLRSYDSCLVVLCLAIWSTVYRGSIDWLDEIMGVAMLLVWESV